MCTFPPKFSVGQRSQDTTVQRQGFRFFFFNSTKNKKGKEKSQGIDRVLEVRELKPNGPYVSDSEASRTEFKPRAPLVSNGRPCEAWFLPL